MKWFSRKPKAVNEPNPWLKIPHDHDWLEANDGTELCCGMCGERKFKWDDQKKSKLKK